MWFDGKAKHHFDEGLAAAAARHYDQAMHEFSVSLSYLPTAECYVQRAKLFARAGDLRELERDVERARELCREGNESKALLNDIEKLSVKLTDALEAEAKFARDVKEAVRKGKIRELLDLYGFENKADQILNMAKPASRLFTTSEQCRLGQSKLGGLPDLPMGCKWPDNPNLSFIAQLNFAEAKRFCQNNGLPDSGILYYFYDAKVQPWGYDQGDRKGSLVIYGHETSKKSLHRSQAPEECLIFPEQALHWEEFLSLPSPLSTEIVSLRLSQNRRDAYDDLYDTWQPEPIHQVLGYPHLSQNPMEGDLGDSKTDWSMLLQVDSDRRPDGEGMTWGSGGKIYLWIRNRDLAKRNFNDIRTLLQCT